MKKTLIKSILSGIIIWWCIGDLYAQSVVIAKVSGEELMGSTCLYRVTSPLGTVTNVAWDIGPASAVSFTEEVAIDIIEVVWNSSGTAIISVEINIANDLNVYSGSLVCIIGVNKTMLEERMRYARFYYPMGPTPPSNSAFYTTTTWNNYVSAFNTANAVYLNELSTQAEVDAAVASLNTTISSLTLASTEAKRNPRNFNMVVIPPQNNLICGGGEVRFNISVSSPLQSSYDNACTWNFDKGNARDTELYIELPTNYTDYFTAASPSNNSEWLPFSIITTGRTPSSGLYRYAGYSPYATMNLRSGLNLQTPVEIPYKVVWRVRLAPTGSGSNDNCSGIGCKCPESGTWATVGYYEGVLIIPASTQPITPTIESNLTGNNFLCSTESATIISTADHPEASYYIWKKDGAVVSEGVGYKALVVRPSDLTGTSNYTLEVLDYGKCVSSTSNAIAITLANVPSFTTQNISYYIGDVVNLTTAVVSAAGSYQYKYYIDEDCLYEELGPTAIASLTQTTKYWVKAIDPISDCETVEEITVTLNDWDFDIISTLSGDGCIGNNVTYTLTLTNNETVKTALNVNVSTLFGLGLTYHTNNPSLGSYGAGVWNIPALAAGTSATLILTFTATATSDLAITSEVISVAGVSIPVGSRQSTSRMVTAYDLPVVSVASIPPLCANGDAVDLIGTPQGGIFSGVGVTGDIMNGFEFDPSQAAIGRNTVLYTYTDNNNCTNSATIEIEVYALPAITVTAPSTGQVTLCESASTTLVAVYTDDGAFEDNLQYYWEYSQTGDIGVLTDWIRRGSINISSGGLVSATYIIPAITQNDAGYYRLVVENLPVSDRPDCRVTSNIILVNMTILPSFVLKTDTTVCTDRLDLRGLISNVSENSTVDFYKDIQATELVLSPIVDVLSDAVYYARSIDHITGCFSEIQSTTILRGSYPVAESITGAHKVCTGRTIILQSAVGGGVWKISDPSLAEIAGTSPNSVAIRGVSEGVTYVSYIIGQICQTTITYIIEVLPDESPEIIIGF